MKKLREENRERAEWIKERKDKQLKIIRDEKVEKAEKNAMRDAGPEGYSKVSKGSRSPH